LVLEFLQWILFLTRGVLVERPFGGCAILVNHSLSSCTKQLFASERFVIVSIGSLTIINVYMSTNFRLANDLCDVMLNEISAVLRTSPNYRFVFAGDMNCNLHNLTGLSSLISTFMTEHNLAFADNNLAANKVMTQSFVI